MIDESRKVLAPFTQRRHLNGDHIDTIIEIFPESTLPDGLFQVPIGGRNQAHIDLYREVAADPFKSPLLKRSSLTWVKALSHLSRVLPPEFSFRVRKAPVKAPFMPEQFAFQQRLRYAAQ
jgi:hypothetical protein